MSEFETAPSSANRDDDAQTMLLITYALYAFGLFFFVPMIAGIVMAHIKYGESVDILYSSHYRWLIRTFWFGLLWSALSIPFLLVFVGFFFLVAIWIWTIYRIVRGFLAFNDRQPMYRFG